MLEWNDNPSVQIKMYNYRNEITKTIQWKVMQNSSHNSVIYTKNWRLFFIIVYSSFLHNAILLLVVYLLLVYQIGGTHISISENSHPQLTILIGVIVTFKSKNNMLLNRVMEQWNLSLALYKWIFWKFWEDLWSPSLADHFDSQQNVGNYNDLGSMWSYVTIRLDCD